MFYRYFIELAYKGTNFHGWQIQPNAPTVQEELERALSIILKEKIGTTGAGRTDTGVHASFFVAHFESVKPDLHNKKNLVYKLNQVLCKDITIKKVIPVQSEAHARFDAVSRTYQYFICQEKNPFNQEFCYQYLGNLDLEKMKEAAALILQYNDFEAFCKLHSDAKTTICKIQESKWIKSNEMLVYTIKADRFLRNMVRAIVGTIFDIGKGRLNVSDMKLIIESKNRSLASASAPAKGLFLTNIEYNNSVYL